ncbi:caspase family protein [Variovorax sp. J22R133]|uniref:caspase family protein n=1 Tax=Variovorax brevis TaxID=3053503 RepID=UPI00257885A9|nr:caspase family protein [Variovorax sp. J22R133]MDM0110542.1 caspase family protein [Variovorax sp. J22R133]
MTVLVDSGEDLNAGVHALVIGVGRYPFLVGGNERPTFQGAAGMKQLNAAPVSAQVMCKWLQTGFDFNGLPLARLDVYASPEFAVVDFQGKPTLTEAPTFAHVRRAVVKWKKRADSNPNNVSVMFFCGHGLSVGEEEALLLEGYGDTSNGDHLAESFSPSGLITGMQSCKAKTQIFVFDACRNVVKAAADETVGLENVPAILRALPSEARSAKVQAVIRSTRLKATAFGAKRGPSRFTEAFIKAMQGAAATQAGDGKWVVDTTSIQAGVDWFMNLDPDSSEQWMEIDSPTPRLRMHWVAGAPVVPVMVTCTPVGVLPTSVLEHRDLSGNTEIRHPAVGRPWHVMLKMADYEFRAYASKSANEIGMAKWQPQPPKAVVAIPCKEQE